MKKYHQARLHIGNFPTAEDARMAERMAKLVFDNKRDLLARYAESEAQRIALLHELNAETAQRIELQARIG
jgi:hypothetical protein